ncbi:hypothetical protein [Aestuariivivens sediminicola]|uniref:hypothetical protein n=1 Tax=Aestuariivivens sediminicola TaxID=2913560 RepID=UPI001F563495|nr:hypothetical protein [Aestuariivivens sediminicola]
MKRHLKVLARFLALLILIQGCSIYKQVSPPYEEAMKHNARVRVKYPHHQAVKFNSIEVIEDNIYGVKKVSGKTVKTLVNVEKAKKIQVKDKTASIIVSIAIPVVLIGVLIAGFSVDPFGKDYTYRY